MKVLIVNNGYPNKKSPNNFVFVHNQSKALKENGYEVSVLNIDLRSIRWKRKFGIFKSVYDGIEIYNVSFPFVTRKLRLIGCFLNMFFGIILAMWAKQNHGKFDIVHAHFGFASGYAGIAIKKIFNIPLVITEHSSKFLLNDSDININWFLKAYVSANKIIVVSEALKKRMNEFKISDVVVIPNVIDTDLFYPVPNKDNKKYTFITVGHLVSSKNQLMILESMKEMGCRCKLLVIGDGYMKKSLKNYADDNKLDVDFLGNIENIKLPDLYNRANCFVLPSFYETFGVVFAEALACGLPVISGNIGGVREIVNKTNGILVNPKSQKELGEAMRYMMKHSKKYNILELHNNIATKFGKENFLNLINRVYKECVGKNG